MKDYEILYNNLFYKKDEPNVKVLDVLVKMDQRYETLNVVYTMDNKNSSWYICGNKKFESLTKRELEEFIDKLRASEQYYMSGDDYEIINFTTYRKEDARWMSIAVAHDEGHFSIIDLSMNIPDDVSDLSIKTDWEYISDKERLVEFLDRFQNFVETN